LNTGFTIHDLTAGGGMLGLCPLPGRHQPFAQDMKAVLEWRPDLVLSMTTLPEMTGHGAGHLGEDMARHGIGWRHLPIIDFGAPGAGVDAKWPDVSALAGGILASGGRVLVHCYGGCGRSGMAVLRLMVEAGESGSEALNRLRAARPCAVETEAQLAWALQA
jgi:Cyclin-dependent kinase inhibitor 3 (CDKN3)